MGRWDEFWRFVVGGGVFSFWFKVLSISLSDTDKAVLLFSPCGWRFWFGRGRAGVDAEGNPRLCGGLEMWDLQWGKWGAVGGLFTPPEWSVAGASLKTRHPTPTEGR